MNAVIKALAADQQVHWGRRVTGITMTGRSAENDAICGANNRPSHIIPGKRTRGSFTLALPGQTRRIAGAGDLVDRRLAGHRRKDGMAKVFRH